MELVLLSDIWISVTATQRTPLDPLTLMACGTYPCSLTGLYIFVHFKNWVSGFQSTWIAHSDPLLCDNSMFWHTVIYWEPLKKLYGQSQSIERQPRASAWLNNKSHLLSKATPLRCREVAGYRNKHRGSRVRKQKNAFWTKWNK